MTSTSVGTPASCRGWSMPCSISAATAASAGYPACGGGYAKVKQFGESDSGFAWQLLAGVYAPISDNIDIGLKYRYFRSSKLDMDDSIAFAAGAGPCGPVGTPSPCSGGTATFGLHDRFTSHSI